MDAINLAARGRAYPPKRLAIEAVAVFLLVVAGATYLAGTMYGKWTQPTPAPMFEPNADILLWPSPPPFIQSSAHPHLALVVDSLLLRAQTMPDFACLHAAHLYPNPANVAVVLFRGEIVVLYDPRIVAVHPPTAPTPVRSLVDPSKMRIRRVGPGAEIGFGRIAASPGSALSVSSPINITSARTAQCLQAIDGLNAVVS